MLNEINNFLASKKIAVIGVSSAGKGFGVAVFKHLVKQGYEVYAVNPKGGTIDSKRIHTSLRDLEVPVEAVITVVPPDVTEKIILDANELGIKKIWMQQGSESEAAINYCKQNDISFVAEECIMMFSEPVQSIHKFHRWLWKLVGKYPN